MDQVIDANQNDRKEYMMTSHTNTDDTTCEAATQVQLKNMFAEEAVSVSASVSDEAVAAFQSLAQSPDPHANYQFFMAASIRRRPASHFIAAYLQDQRRPKRFDDVLNYLILPTPALENKDEKNEGHNLFLALQSQGIHAIGEILTPLRQSPAHLARIFQETDIVYSSNGIVGYNYAAPYLWEDVASLAPHPHYFAGALSRWRTMSVFLGEGSVLKDLETKMSALGESHPELLAKVLSAKQMMHTFVRHSKYKTIENCLSTLKDHPELLSPLLDKYEDLALSSSRKELSCLEVNGIPGKCEERKEDLRAYIAQFEERIQALRPTTTGMVTTITSSQPVI